MDYSVDKKGMLHGDKVEHIIVDKDSGLFEGDFPDMIVMHYTGGSSFAGAVSHLQNHRVKASAHLVIGRDGRIAQMVPFVKKAWHAGKSEFGERIGINKYGIGIEMDNAGPMKQVGDAYISEFGRRYSTSEVVKAVHRNESEPRLWHTYAEEQIACAFEVCSVLTEQYAISFIVGHEEISPYRKTDPGPAFPLEKLRDRIFEARSEEAPILEVDSDTERHDLGVVTASMLNFREDPSAFGRLLSEPLPAGTPLQVIKERNGWYQVRVEQVGWVKKEYVRV
jgi:N-acetylmuramoyl-L-alanine amidase